MEVSGIRRYREYVHLYFEDISYRTKISLYTSLAINLFYAAFKLIFGIYYASFWYGADALYYIVLSAARIFMLPHVQNEQRDLAKEFRQYRSCGYLLFALNAALTGVVYQVINHDMSRHYPGLMIYAVAAFAFFCLTLAIVNVVRYRKHNSPVLSAIKAISLAKALVAIFSLQTAMLTSFGGDGNETFSRLMKSLTGGGVCLFIFGMAVFMIVRANKNLSINNSET